jgi:hypothetical protein
MMLGLRRTKGRERIRAPDRRSSECASIVWSFTVEEVAVGTAAP